MIHRRSLIPAALLALAVTPALVGSAAASEPPAQESAPLRLLWAEPTQGFDPAIAQAAASLQVMDLMYGTLTQSDFDKTLVGNLIEGWEVSDDGLVYTLTLRETGFSDGTPVTADDLEFSLDRMRESTTMQGALEGVTSVDIVDDRTVTITLDRPYPPFMQNFRKQGITGILSTAAVEADPDYFTLPDVTSGPFVLTEYVPGDHATLVRNEHFYQVPLIPEIRITFSGDQTAAAAALESGSTDISTIGYSDVERLQDSDAVQLFSVDSLTPTFFGWDRTAPPFDSVEVRQAFAFAVDRDGAEQACWFNTGAVTYGNLLRPSDPAYIEIDTYRTADREEAAQRAGELLDAAGWVLDDSGERVAQGVAGVDDGTRLEVEVQYENNWPAASCHTQVLQASLKDVGVTVTPVAYDAASFYQQVAAGEFTMYHGGAGARDAYDLYLNWFRCGGTYTELTTHLCDEELDARIDEALYAPAEADAIEIFHELEQWQAEVLPMLVTVYQFGVLGVNARVHDFQLAVNSRALVYAWVEG